MKVKILFMVLSATVLFGCATYRLSKFYLPHDETEIHKPIFVSGNDTGEKILEATGLFSSREIHKLIYPSDAGKQILEASLFSSTDTIPYGYAMLTTKWVKSKGTMATPARRALVVLSGLTVTTINLLGVPMSWATEETELEFTIFDALGSMIKSYSSIGKGKAYMGYYRYSESGSEKAAATDSIKKALEGIRSELKNDYRLINEKLSSTGPINVAKLDLALEAHPEWELGIYLTKPQRAELIELRKLKAKEENLQRQKFINSYSIDQFKVQEFIQTWNIFDPYRGKMGIMAIHGSSSDILAFTIGYNTSYFGLYGAMAGVGDRSAMLNLFFAKLFNSVKDSVNFTTDVDFGINTNSFSGKISVADAKNNITSVGYDIEDSFTKFSIGTSDESLFTDHSIQDEMRRLNFNFRTFGNTIPDRVTITEGGRKTTIYKEARNHYYREWGSVETIKVCDVLFSNGVLAEINWFQ